jgi:hypothetical protein
MEAGYLGEGVSPLSTFGYRYTLYSCLLTAFGFLSCLGSLTYPVIFCCFSMIAHGYALLNSLVSFPFLSPIAGATQGPDGNFNSTYRIKTMDGAVREVIVRLFSLYLSYALCLLSLLLLRRFSSFMFLCLSRPLVSLN